MRDRGIGFPKRGDSILRYGDPDKSRSFALTNYLYAGSEPDESFSLIVALST